MVCSTMKPREVTEEQIKLRAFPFSLADKAKDWLKDMCGIRQFNGETLYEYWERFKQLCASCPQHQVTDQLLIQYFYEGLLIMDRNMIDAGSGRALVHKTPTEARTLISNMAGNSQYNKTIVKACGICSVVGHPTDMCPTLQDSSPEQMNVVGGFPGPPQRKYDPFSNTYNPGWRDHPNFSYGSHIVKTLATSTQQFQQDTKSTIQHLENQIGQLATSVNRLESQALGKLSSQTVNNLKQNVSAITLRSRKVLKEQALKPSKRDLEKEIVKEGSTSQNDQPQETNSPQDEIKILPPFPGRFAKSRKQEQEKEILETFRKVEVNIPLLDAIKQVPRYAKFLKELCTSKRKLKGNEKVLLGENVSAMIQKKLPIKCKDPGMFTIPCKMGNVEIERAMLDLGSSINVMPRSIYE
ncbi:uncharacterized protein Tco_0112077, partial [Tanacetum coccineum]